LSARESEAQTRTIDKLTTEEFVNTNPNVAGGRGSASNVYRRMKWFVGWVEASKCRYVRAWKSQLLVIRSGSVIFEMSPSKYVRLDPNTDEIS
jgi:hypothetical protein